MNLIIKTGQILERIQSPETGNLLLILSFILYYHLFLQGNILALSCSNVNKNVSSMEHKGTFDTTIPLFVFYGHRSIEMLFTLGKTIYITLSS